MDTDTHMVCELDYHTVIYTVLFPKNGLVSLVLLRAK